MAMGSMDSPDMPSTNPDMQYEKRRLETFRNWPANAVIDPQRIAKAGFYSTGTALEVKCFSCGNCICDWEYGDQVMTKHRNLSPECAFVKNPLECGNVPLLPAVGSQVDYRKEAERLASFRGWPATVASPFVTPKSLARNGLYYLREDDKVKCAFCSVELCGWQEGDRPLREHRRASPECPLLFGYMVGNVPVDASGSGAEEGDEEDDEIEETDSPGTTSQSTSSPEEYVEIRPFAVSGHDSNKQLADHPQFGVQAHKPPIHTKYQTYEARLASFREWPSALPTPETLADAGFYYQGMLDHACCFHCNGGLHNWDPADDPWEEHARWFSRCPFVGIVKGRDFIQAAISKKPPIIPISQVVPPQPEERGEDVTGLSEASSHPQHSSDLNGQSEAQRGAESQESETDLAQQINPVVVNNEPITTNETLQIAGTSTQQATNSPMNAEAGLDMSKLNLHSNTQENQDSTLLEENRRLTEARLCKVCLDDDVGVVFLPCGHLITCVKCAPNLAQCPMCREKIQACVRTFFS